MSDPITQAVDTAAVAAADSGISGAQTAIDALLAEKFPGVSAVAIPLVDRAAAEVKAFVAAEIPKLVLAAEHDLQDIGARISVAIRPDPKWKKPSDCDLRALYEASITDRVSSDHNLTWGYSLDEMHKPLELHGVAHEMRARGLVK